VNRLQKIATMDYACATTPTGRLNIRA